MLGVFLSLSLIVSLVGSVEPTRKASIARPHCGPFKHKSRALGHELASGFQTEPLSRIRLVVDMSTFMHSGDLTYSKTWGLKWIYIGGHIHCSPITSHLVFLNILAGTDPF